MILEGVLKLLSQTVVSSLLRNVQIKKMFNKHNANLSPEALSNNFKRKSKYNFCSDIPIVRQISATCTKASSAILQPRRVASDWC